MLWSETCMREIEGCRPIANIHSDDLSSFICCGLSTEETRTVPQDKFRLCFHNKMTDSMFDHDETDLKDLSAIISVALAMQHRLWE